MKRIFLFALLLAHPLAAFTGLDVGVGFSWNTIDESFDSKLQTSENKSGQDEYKTGMNRFAPVVQIGYRYFFCSDWAVGLLAQWKYLNYKTPNVNRSRGQILPNATFSSINIFGPNIDRDFTSISRLKNEVLLLGYLGTVVLNGYAYLGLGSVLFNASNSVYNSSVHTPNGAGDHLVSTSVTSHRTIWGGAAQIGYQYCLTENSMINFSYTYLQTGNYHFNNTVNAATLNGANAPGPTTLFLKRAINFSAQEFMLYINLMF